MVLIMINELLNKMAAQGASDLFISAGKTPYVRVSTRIQALNVPPIPAVEIEQFRMQTLGPEAEKKYQHAGSVDTGLSLDSVRYRINFLIQQGQPGLVARLVPSGELDFAHLNLPKTLAEFAERPRGLVLIVGAAGSGKSTTMAAMLNHINAKFAKHIVTIEDPIEFVFEDNQSVIEQREVGLDTVSFHHALKHVLRQDPDIIMLGEMRDATSFGAAMSAADTGHLVLSTLHTTTAAQSITRILDFFKADEREQVRRQLAGTLRGVVCQRMVPTIDGKMTPALEIMINSPLIKKMLEDNRLEKLTAAIETGADDGMLTFNQSLFNLVKEGRVSEKEALAKASNPQALEMNFKGIFLNEGGRIVG